jgi:hypothetical protein
MAILKLALYSYGIASRWSHMSADDDDVAAMAAPTV